MVDHITCPTYRSYNFSKTNDMPTFFFGERHADITIEQFM